MRNCWLPFVAVDANLAGIGQVKARLVQRRAGGDTTVAFMNAK